MKLSISTLLTTIVLILFLGAHAQAQPIRAIPLGSYYQEVKTLIDLPREAEPNTLRLFQWKEAIVVVTSNGVFRHQKGDWSGKPFGSGWRTAAMDAGGAVWLASDRTIQKEGAKQKIELPEYALKDTILCLMWENEKLLLVGTTGRLLSYDGSWNAIPFTLGKRINGMTLDRKGDPWLATSDGLLRRMGGKWLNMDDHLMAVGLNRSYSSVESHPAKGEVIFGGQYTIGAISEEGDHWLLSGADGLPYGPSTSIHQIGKSIWLGTDRGAVKKDQTWHYYHGKRWLPSNRVNDILPIGEHTVWIATAAGISQIREQEMTLGQKAAAFEERIRLRHDRYGLVSPSKLSKPGDLTTNKTLPNDNDGLWTSLYLAAECYRYSVTKDPDARALAIRSYEALERLESVTGIPGYPARTFAAATDSVLPSRSPHPKKWHPSADGQWQWMDDTSSDEIVGHLFAIPLFYELVADGEWKERSRNLIHRVMTHVVDHDFQLIDFDGLPTRWAIWNPDSLNNSPGWWYEHGLNSLQILSFLKSATKVTGDQKFEKAYQLLVKKHHYAENAKQVKMFGPYENSHSDDILTYLPYYNLAKYAKDDPLLPLYTRSLQRTWSVARPDGIPLWNIIASSVLQKDCDLQVALTTLQQLPMDLISWTMTNSHRWDLPRNPVNGRGNVAQSVRPIPIAEGVISKWNSNTHLYDTGNDGLSEDDGAYFLLPYWMGRYHGYFDEK